MSRGSGWILTYTGRQFWPLDPRKEDLCIEDIAHALSNICRFTGHVRTFYSVAEHCVRASHHAPDELKLAMLLHDASEAYLCDLSRPVKHLPALEAYREAEDFLMNVIGDRYGVEFTDPRIHEIDTIMLLTEKRDLMAPNSDSWNVYFPGVSLLAERIEPRSPQQAETLFLNQFDRLTTPA